MCIRDRGLDRLLPAAADAGPRTTFLLFFAAPEDPARLTCGKNCTPAVIEGNRKALGYDKPLAVQYAKFLQGIFVDRKYPDDPALQAASPEIVTTCQAPCLGYSVMAHKSVTEIVKDTLPVSASIALAAFVLWMIVGAVSYTHLTLPTSDLV